MHPEPTGPEVPGDRERAILGLLLGEQQLWSTRELVAELGQVVATVDAIDGLVRAALVHRLESDMVVASRAARVMAEMWP